MTTAVGAVLVVSYLLLCAFYEGGKRAGDVLAALRWFIVSYFAAVAGVSTFAYVAYFSDQANPFSCWSAWIWGAFVTLAPPCGYAAFCAARKDAAG